jgi:DNA-binding transcriptional regulator YiaG
MPNVAAILKSEISRVARKASRGETESLRKAVSQYRTEIFALKKRMSTIESELARRMKSAERTAPASTEEETHASGFRFSAKGLASKRKALGLSASDVGFLLNTTGQSIYSWESGVSRPRAKYMPAIAAFRTLGKKHAFELLESLRAKPAH